MIKPKILIAASFTFLFLMSSILMPAQAQSPVDSVVDENAVSNVTITDTGVKFNVSVPWQELGLEVVTENGKQYTRVSLEGWTETGQAGAPLLPMLVQQAAVPVGAEVELWVVSGEAHRIPLSAAVLPVETMRVGIIQRGEALPQLEYVIEEDAAIYGGGEYPGALAMVMNDGMLRQQRVVGLSIYPVQYDAAANELIVYESLEVELKYSGGMLSGAAEADSEVYEEVFAGELLNYESSQEMREAQGGMMMRSFSMFGAGASLPWAPPSPAWRVKVREDGLYKLTHYELVTADAGFGTPDSSMLQLFNQGIETAIQVLDVNGDGVFNSTSAADSDAILFYGQKVESKYTYDNVYWLTYGAASGLRMSSRSAVPGGGGQPAYYWANRHYEEKHVYWPILDEDAERDRYYWHMIENPDPNYGPQPSDFWEFIFNTPTSYAGETAELRLRLLGAFDLPYVNLEHHALITLNGTQIGDVSWDGMVYHEVVLDNVQLLAGENTVKVTLPGDNMVGLDRVYVEWAKVNFPANFMADGDVLEFTTAAGPEYQYQLSGFTTPDLALYDVSDPWNVQEIVGTAISANDTYELAFTDAVSGAPDYLAQSRALFKTVNSIVADTPSNLQSGSNGADYILITPSAFWDAAGTLTAYRSGQGLRSVRVDVQDIYDEFNYGVVSANAIHDFLKHTYENWSGVAPSYVVLLGDGNYDPKNYEGSSKTSFIPPYLASVDPWMGETAGDNRYVTVSGNDTMPDLMLGRLAVNSAAEAADFVNKIIAYEANPSEAWQNQVLAVTDNADPGGNFPLLSDNLLTASLAAPFTAEKVYLNVTHVTEEAARTAIRNHINAGKLIVNFIGHGAYNRWAAEGLLMSTDISSLANGNKLPIMLVMACNDGYYIYPQDNPIADAMAEALTRAQGKGAIASWSATALGLASGHTALNQGFMETLLSDESVRLGQATQAGKLRLWSTNSNLDLLDTFLLFGDPALVVKRVAALKIEGTITTNSAPLADVTVTSSNGKVATTDSNGHFVFKGLPTGTYTFTPSKTGYSFDPQVSTTQNLTTSDISGVNFSASLAPIYTISGTVTNHLGNPLSGVTITDDKGHSTTSGTLGEYALSGLTLGTYQVSAVKDDYVFRVPSYTVEITGASRSGINFTGLPLLSISGVISHGSQPLEGVELSVVSYEGSQTLTTNSAGEFLIDNLTPEEYVITPQLAGYDFTPATQTVPLNLEDIGAINFQAEYRIKGSDIPDQFILRGDSFTDIALDDYVADPDYSDAEISWTFTGNTNLNVTITDRVARISLPNDSWTGTETITFRATNPLELYVEDTANFTLIEIQGTITTNSAPLAGVTVTSSNGKVATTDSNGHFIFEGLPPGTYTFTPSKTGYTFNPEVSAPQVLSTGSISNVDFSASLAPIYTISGTVTNHLGPLAGVTITDDKGHSTTSGTLGEYSLSGLTLGIYQVSVVKDDYIFRVPSYTVEITGASHNGINFTGLPLLSISGVISKGSQPLEGVQLSVLSAEGSQTVSTNSAGEYLIDNLTPEEYVITPQLAGYDFTPATQTVALNLEDIGAINFQAEYRIKGSDIPDQFILRGDSFADIALDDYVADPDYSDAEISWTFTGNTNLNVTISDRVASISVPDNIWPGFETITFRATNPLGLYVEDTATFTVFDFSPEAEQKLAAKRATFQWTALPNANQYTLQVSLSPSFTSTVVNITTNQPTYAYTKDLTDRQTYYWRVRARYGSIWGEWMPTQQFYSMNPPMAPVLTAPAAGNYFNLGTLDFTWDAVANDHHYEFEINKSSAFKADANRVVYETNLDRDLRTFTAAGLANGVYYWRVRAEDEVGVFGAWSAVRSLSLYSGTAPTAKTPLANASISTNTPVFTINPVAGAKWYRFRVVEGADCEVGVMKAESADISATSWTIPAANSLPFGDNYIWCAKAIDIAGSESLWLSVPFTITIQNQPAAGLTTLATTPTFTWYKVNGASGYELVVEPVAETGNTPTQTYTAALGTVTSHAIPAIKALDAGVYQWRIRVFKSTGVDETPWRKLVILPPAPRLSTAPAVVSTKTPTLKWDEVSSAARYELQLSRNNKFNPLVALTGADTITQTNYTIPAAQGEGVYYWRVRGLNYLGNAGAWSAVRSFTVDAVVPGVFTLKSPAANAAVNGAPQFSWNGSGGAKYYTVEIDVEGGNFTTPQFTSAKLTSTSLKSNFTLLGSYDWRVVAEDLAGNKTSSKIRKLTIKPLKPAAPSLSKPLHGYLDNDPDNQITLTWAAPLYADKYNLQVSKDSKFSKPDQFVVNELTNETSRLLPEVPHGVYYWRVQAVNTISGISNWSAVRSITIDLVPPVPPVLSAPANNSQPAGTPTFSWKASSTAVRYEFAYGEKVDGAVIETWRSPEHAATTIKPPMMEVGKDFYWFVRARDAAGNWSGWSAPYKVLIKLPLPAAVIQELPMNAAFIKDKTPELSWKAVDYSASYELQLSRNNKFNPLEPLVGADSITPRNYTIPTELAEGVYYWRVRAKNSDNLPGAWSAVRSFTVDTLSPAAPALNQPLPNALVNGTTPTLSVKSVPGAYYYQFIVTADPTCQLTDALANSGKNNTKTSWTVPAASALAYGDYYWCARAIDAARNESVWSTARSFSVTFQKSPAHGFITGSAMPAFAWYSVPGAIGYKLEVEPVIEAGNTATRTYEIYLGPVTSYTIPLVKALDPGKYQWRLLARTAGGYRETPYKTFVVLPPAPQLISPVNNYIFYTLNTPSLEFTWSETAGAASYIIEVNNRSDFKGTGISESITTGEERIDLTMSLNAGKYYWRVAAVNYLGNTTYSAARTLTVKTP